MLTEKAAVTPYFRCSSAPTLSPRALRRARLPGGAAARLFAGWSLRGKHELRAGLRLVTRGAASPVAPIALPPIVRCEHVIERRLGFRSRRPSRRRALLLASYLRAGVRSAQSPASALARYCPSVPKNARMSNLLRSYSV
jgi:hypothetical protein